MKIFVFAVCLLIACVSYVTAQGGSVTAVDAGDNRVRVIQINTFPLINPRILEVKAISAERSTNHGQVDAVEFILSDFNQTALLFAYFHAEGDIPPPGSDGSGVQNGQASAFAFVFRVFGVFEYEEHNSILGFQPNTADNGTGFYDLSDITLSWKPMNATKQILTDAQGQTYEYHTIQIQTSDDVFLLRFHIATRPVQIGSVVTTPDSCKIDVELRWFNNPSFTGPTAYSTGPSDAVAHPNALVGIVCFAAAAAGTASVNQGSGSDKPGVSFAAGAVGGFFVWEDSADSVVASGAAAAAVHAFEYNDPNADYSAHAASGWVVKVFTFTFQAVRPTFVGWDPEMGGQIDYSSAPGLVACSVLSLLAMLFAMMF